MEIKYRITEQGAVIEKCLGTEERVKIPETVEGCPVHALDAYAFSEARAGASGIGGERLHEISLPGSLKKIGNYAFYGCRNLEKMTLCHTIEDIGGGAFTGCYRLRELDISMQNGVGYCFKEIIGELRRELRVTLRFEGGKQARLLFPEYYEEAVENTPARILETHFHGSGYPYRQCFQGGVFQFQEYDGLFFEAAAWEGEDFCIELSLSRLEYPWKLSEDAKGIYMAWLMEHRMSAANWCIEFERDEDLEFMSTFTEWSGGELLELIQKANQRGRTGIQSFLMDYKFRNRKQKQETFEL
ncbi:MAG: leucine-rich repeat domain-containing protein [Eubacteriales bacterium]|nr:leucine-rich repeat domain-containing protein [Eubacteriales bacterium]